MTIQAQRTPDDRFQNLPGFPFEPHYAEDLPGFPGLRMHYLDEGSADSGEVFLCLHGQPTWGYLYRKMVPVFAGAGHRVVVPDLFGFGRSDKPVEEELYTFELHRLSLLALIEKLDLRNVTLVVQDWGGMIGLTLPMELESRIRRLVVMNTALATGTTPMPDAFFKWRDWCRENPDIPVGKVMKKACASMTSEEVAAYEAPYPDTTYKGGVRRFPELVPTKEHSPGAGLSRQALRWLMGKWQGETYMTVGGQDPMLGPPVMKALARAIRGCPEPVILDDVHHFVQEEAGEQVARGALEAFGL